MHSRALSDILPVQVKAGVSNGAGGRCVVSNKGEMSKLETTVFRDTGPEHKEKINLPPDAHY